MWFFFFEVISLNQVTAVCLTCTWEFCFPSSIKHAAKLGCFLPNTRVTGEFSITDSLKHLHWYFYFQPFLQYFRGVWSSFRWLRDKTIEKEEGMVPPVTRLLGCGRMKQLIPPWNDSRPVSAVIRTQLGSTPTRQPPSLTTGITL